MSEKKKNVPAAVILAEAIRTETVRVRISRAAEEADGDQTAGAEP